MSTPAIRLLLGGDAPPVGQGVGQSAGAAPESETPPSRLRRRPLHSVRGGIAGGIPRAIRSGQPCSAFTMVEPRAAGLSATWIPALRIASIFAAAVSFPPEITAPA